jgi:hypothetical protein
LAEGAERSEAEGFFLSVSDAAKIKTLSFSFCRGEATGKNPSGSGQKDVRTHLPLAREAYELWISRLYPKPRPTVIVCLGFMPTSILAYSQSVRMITRHIVLKMRILIP